MAALQPDAQRLKPDPVRRERARCDVPERGLALVTGASSGIGAAIARSLAAEGRWNLVVAGRDPARLALTAESTRAAAITCDLSTVQGVRSLVAEAVASGRRLELVVAAAGVGWAGPFASMPMAAVEQVLAVDLAAVIQLVRSALPHMLLQRRGHLVLVGSVAGAVGVRNEAVYSAAKAGLSAFADALRYELAGTGVRVIHVVPGAVATPFFARRGAPYDRSFPRQIPPERVASAVLEAVHRGSAEVYVPGWLRLPTAIKGLAPGLYRRLAGRFG